MTYKNHLFIAALLLVSSPAALAQNAAPYPVKPIRMTIPTSPGSSMDMVARVVAAKVAEAVGQPVVAETRAGANGFIGAEHVARAAPDGYTIMVNSASNLIIPYYVAKKLPFDPRKDFTPITAVVESLTVLAVHPSLPVQSVKELVDYIKKNPGKLSYSSPGIGSMFHLNGEILQNLADASIVHVPYKGAAPAVTAAETGEVQVLFTATNNVIPLHKSGRMRALAVMGRSRFAGLPGVPPMAEAYPAMKNIPGWFGFLGPSGLPAPVLGRLNTEIVKVVTAPDVRAKFEAGALNVVGNSPEEFAALYAQTFEVMAAIVKDAGIKPE